MTTGVFARTALTGVLYRRALRFTPAARLQHPNSAVLNHVSTDISRVDACAQWFHAAWTAPIQSLFGVFFPIYSAMLMHNFFSANSDGLPHHPPHRAWALLPRGLRPFSHYHPASGEDVGATT